MLSLSTSIGWCIEIFGAGKASPFALEEATGASNSDGLVHYPLADAKILFDPFGDLLVLASYSIRSKRQTGRPLHTSEESRQEDGVEGIMRQTSNHHDG